MSTAQQLQTRLEEAFAPAHMALTDESYKHNVPPGAESHFNLVIASDAFEGKPLLQRERAVHKALGPAMDKIHALTIRALTPQEWDAAGGQVTHQSPECLGGGKRA